MVAVPCMVMRKCSAGGGFICFVATRWMASTVTTSGRISFQSMVPVRNLHVGVMRRMWFPWRGSWQLSGTWWMVRGFGMCCTVVVGSASFWGGRSCSLSRESFLVGAGVVVD